MSALNPLLLLHFLMHINSTSCAILKSFCCCCLGRLNFNTCSVLLGFAPVSREVSKIADSNSIVIWWFQGVSRSIDGFFPYNSLPVSKRAFKPSIHYTLVCSYVYVCIHASVCVCVQTCLCVSAAVVRPSLVKRGKKKKACGARKSPASRPTSQSPSMMSAIATTC